MLRLPYKEMSAVQRLFSGESFLLAKKRVHTPGTDVRLPVL